MIEIEASSKTKLRKFSREQWYQQECQISKYKLFIKSPPPDVLQSSLFNKSYGPYNVYFRITVNYLWHIMETNGVF